MINFSIQNFIPFLVPPLFLLGLRNIGKKGGEMETKQDLVGPSQRNPFMFPASCLALPGLQIADSSSNDENNTVIGLLVPPE